MASFTSKVFWLDSGERAVKTFVQTILAAVGTSAATTAITDVDWAGGALIGLSAAVISVFTSILTSGVGNNGTASAVPEVVAAPEHTL